MNFLTRKQIRGVKRIQCPVLVIGSKDDRVLGSKPNLETIEAMLEAERIAVDPQIKGYTVDEAFEELEKD